MRSDIREGVTLPDYELEDQAGRRRSLSKLQGGNAMVVHLPAEATNLGTGPDRCTFPVEPCKFIDLVRGEPSLDRGD